MADLIETSDYPAVRAAIRASLDEASLPDDVIALTIYKGVATATIQRSTLAVDTYSKAAAITLCAALLCHAVDNLISETDAGVTTTVEPWDAEQMESKLRALSSTLLSLSLNLTPQAVRAARMPNLFDVSHGSRRGA